MATSGGVQYSQSTPEFGRTFEEGAGQTLGRNLAALAARRNARQLLDSLACSLAWGVSICALLMLAHRFYLADVSPWAILTILAASLIIGARNGTLRRAGVFDAALDADKALGLDDRLSSAMAFVQPQSVRSANLQSGGNFLHRLRAWVLPRHSYRTSVATSPTELVPALVVDAAARSSQAQPKQIYPAKFDRAKTVLAVASVALIGFSLMPNMEILRTPEQRAVAAALNRNGKKLEEIAKQVRAKKAEEANPETKKLAGKLKALGLKMQRGRMSKREALVSMGQLKKDMEKSAQNESSSGGLENIEQLQQNLADQGMQSPDGQAAREAAKKRDANKAADALEKLADKMEKGNLSADEKNKAANDMEKAARALRQSGGEQNADAARKLEEAAKQLREGDKQNGQNGQQGQKGPQNQNGQKDDQKDGQQQNGQKQGAQGQQGGQKDQQNQNGQQDQKKDGQQQGQQQQGSQGQQQQGGQQPQSQNGQGQQGGQQQGQQGQQNQQGGQGGQSGSNALRNLAKGLRESGAQNGNSENTKKMLDKIREAENDTGQNGGNQSGDKGPNGQGDKPGQGEGGKSGQGQGKGQPGQVELTDPEGQVGGGAGLGPRSKAGSVGKGGGVSNAKSTRSGDKRRWEDVWSDRLPETQKKASRITGKMGDSGNMEQLPTRTEAKGGPVKTPYYEVYESYKRDAEDAVGKDNVPPAYKQPVRDYFDSLKPGK